MIEIPDGLLGRDVDLGVVDVTAEMIATYARAVGDVATMNGPLDVAPPTFCLVLHRGMTPEIPLPPECFGVYGGHDMEFLQPIRAGERCRMTARVADVYEKSGRSGRMTIVVRDATIHDVRGTLLTRITERQIVRQRPPAGATPPTSPANDPTSQRSNQVTSEPGNQQTSEPTNPTPDIGTELGPQRRHATTTVEVAAYVGAGAMKERMFVDPDHARALGYRGIIVPGPMITAFLDQFLRGQLSGWTIETLGTTFRVPTITGDAITIHGVVTEHHQRTDGDRLVCDLVVEHPDGEPAVTGIATMRRARLP